MEHIKKNLSLTQEDMMDYHSDASHIEISDEPVFFDTDHLYQDILTLGGENLSQLGFGEFDSSDFVLGGTTVSSLMVSYMNTRPYIVGSLLVLIAIIGVCANISLLILVLRKGWESLSFASVLVVNLSCACLLFLIGGIPLLLFENVFGYGWTMGTLTCQLHRYLVYVSFFTISYAVVLLLLHQTVALYIPGHMLKIESPAYSLGLCFSVWAVILLANIPNYLGHGITEEVAGISYCYNKEVHNDMEQMKAWTILHFVFSFAFPFALMAICITMTTARITCGQLSEYNRLRETIHERKDYVAMAMIVTLMYVLCWGPDKIFSLLLVLHPRRMDAPTLIASDVMMILAYSNPTVNPLLMLFSGMRELQKSRSSNGPFTNRSIAEATNSKQDHSNSTVPLCLREEIPDPEMITTV